MSTYAAICQHMVKLPSRGDYFGDPPKYNYRFVYKFLVLAGTPQNFVVALYGRWEALDACGILPRGVGMICPHFWETTSPPKAMCGCPFLLIITCVLQSVTFLYVSNEVPQAKWPYRPWDHFIVFMNKCAWHCIYQSDPCFPCKTCFPHCLHTWQKSLCAT